jgi:hypothetical protein
MGLPHSTTLAREITGYSFREVVECGSPKPLSLVFIGGDNIREMGIVATSFPVLLFSLSSTGGEEGIEFGTFPSQWDFTLCPSAAAYQARPRR